MKKMTCAITFLSIFISFNIHAQTYSGKQTNSSFQVGITITNPLVADSKKAYSNQQFESNLIKSHEKLLISPTTSIVKITQEQKLKNFSPIQEVFIQTLNY